jgi:hypothetical protein
MSNIVPWTDQERMADAIAESGLFGLKDRTQVLALMAVAQAEGRHPASVARDYHIIEGRPSLKADAMLARFQAAGGSVVWEVYTDAKVEAVFSHPQGGTLRLAWTFEQAKRAGICMGRSGVKDNWAKYPRAMLRARVISEGIRTIYPGVLVGEYTPEEVEDFTPASRLKDVTVDITPDGMPVSRAHLELVDGKATIVRNGHLDNGTQMELAEELGDELDGTPAADVLRLYVPDPKVSPEGGRLYGEYGGPAEFMDAYLDLLDRVTTSTKLTNEEKAAKKEIFKNLNKATRDHCTAILDEELKNVSKGAA